MRLFGSVLELLEILLSQGLEMQEEGENEIFICPTSTLVICMDSNKDS